jgi:hypothetical protein
MTSVFTILLVDILNLLVKSPVPYGYILLSVLHVILVYAYNIHKASVRLG